MAVTRRCRPPPRGDRTRAARRCPALPTWPDENPKEKFNEVRRGVCCSGRVSYGGPRGSQNGAPLAGAVTVRSHNALACLNPRWVSAAYGAGCRCECDDARTQRPFNASAFMEQRGAFVPGSFPLFAVSRKPVATRSTGFRCGVAAVPGAGGMRRHPTSRQRSGTARSHVMFPHQDRTGQSAGAVVMWASAILKEASQQPEVLNARIAERHTDAVQAYKRPAARSVCVSYP